MLYAIELMRKILKISLFGGLALLFIATIGFFSIESYWPFYPYIDTKFSQNFTEKAFNEIDVGASMQDVLSKIGDPIWKIGCGGCWEPEFYSTDGVIRVPPKHTCSLPCDADDQRWQFSDDGACTWWDFAWKDFSIDLHHRKVAAKFTMWHYD